MNNDVWTPIPMYCSNCGQLIYGYRNEEGKIDKGESDNKKLVLKFIDEEMESDNDIIIYGSGFGSSLAPQFVVTYESGYAINTSYRTHTHELGRFGQGSIDLQRGNLMFESEDFAWAGNRRELQANDLSCSGKTFFRLPAAVLLKFSRK